MRLKSRHENSIFKGKFAVYDEAVDKLGFWSPLLHVFYLYAYVNKITREDVLSFVLFFCHQCNTTEIIIQSFIDLINEKHHASSKKIQTLYNELCKRCEIYNKNKNSYDVGSGGSYPRFSTSRNLTFNIHEVRKWCSYLNKCFSECYETFNKKEKKM